MKKISIVSFASFAFLLLCSGISVIFKNVFSDAVLPLVVGICVLTVSGIIAFFAKEHVILNLICFLLSSVAMGFLIRAWYINRGFDNSFSVMCLISFAAVLYLWVFFALTRIPFVHRSKATYVILCVLYVLISAVAYIFVMLKTETTYVSTFGYYMIIELAFIFAMSLEVHTRDELIRNLTLSTYSVFIVAIVAAVFILFAVLGDGDCDCDCVPDGCCDCIDCCDYNHRAKNKKRR